LTADISTDDLRGSHLRLSPQIFLFIEINKKPIEEKTTLLT
jgi:hypothetical protein